MDSKLTSVKNPLTVIAIFAGIAEISGTAVLPHIAADNQALYIWFLMLFPFALIALFFLTLNFNHRVLYAPSDFRDEDNFVNILKKSTYSEVLEYKEKEVVAIAPEEISEPLPQQDQDQAASDVAKNIDSETLISSTTSVEKLVSTAETAVLELGSVTTRSQRNQMDIISRQVTQQRMRDLRLAERLALERLEKELGVSIDRDMKIESGHSTVHFDGIARRGSSLTAIEVKYFRSRRSAPMNIMMWQDLRRSLETLFQSLSDEQRRDFSFILVIVNDDDADEVERMAAKRLANLSFPIAIKVYDFDSLLEWKNS